MLRQKIFFFFVVALFCALSSPLYSQETAPTERLGRLSDGRAYRIDEHGYRLVDHVAELEVTVDDLQRQNRALEDEINELRKGELSRPKSNVKETTILSSSSNAKTATDSYAVNVSENTAKAEVKAEQVCDATRCSMLIAPLQQRITELERKLNTQTAPVAALNCELEKKPLWEQIDRLQHVLMEGPSKERCQAAIDSGKERDESIAALKAQLQEMSALQQSLEARLGEKDRQLAEKERRERELAGELAVLSEKVAEQSVPPQVEIAEEASMRSKLTLAEPVEKPPLLADAAAITAAKDDLQKQLTAIQQLISDRKSLADKLAGSSKGIAITMQALNTSSGVSLDTLRQQVKELSQTSDLDGLKKGLTEIADKLRDDIGVLKRLS